MTVTAFASPLVARPAAAKRAAPRAAARAAARLPVCASLKAESFAPVRRPARRVWVGHTVLRELLSSRGGRSWRATALTRAVARRLQPRWRRCAWRSLSRRHRCGPGAVLARWCGRGGSRSARPNRKLLLRDMQRPGPLATLRAPAARLCGPWRRGTACGGGAGHRAATTGQISLLPASRARARSLRSSLTAARCCLRASSCLSLAGWRSTFCSPPCGRWMRSWRRTRHLWTRRRSAAWRQG